MQYLILSCEYYFDFAYCHAVIRPQSSDGQMLGGPRVGRIYGQRGLWGWLGSDNCSSHRS